MEFFVTYNSKNKQLAGDIGRILKNRGHSAFLAHDDIQPSTDWLKEILRHLDTCSALIAVVTPEFAKSDYTNQEIGFILGKGKPIVALRFQKTELPGFLSWVQAINASPATLSSDTEKAVRTAEERLKNSVIRPKEPVSAKDFVDSLLDRRRERYWRFSISPLEPYEFIPASQETDDWFKANHTYIWTDLTSRPIKDGLAFERSDSSGSGDIYSEIRTNGEICYGVALLGIEQVHPERAAQVAGNTMEFASRIYRHFPHEQNRRGHVMAELKLALAHRQALRTNQLPIANEQNYITDEAEVIVSKKFFFEDLETDWRSQLEPMMIELCRHFGVSIGLKTVRAINNVALGARENQSRLHY